MKGFKGFDKDWKCKNKKFEVGKTYREKKAELCKQGLHFCEDPIDIFSYYPPIENHYAEIEAKEVSDETESDSKRVCKEIKIVKEISLKDIADESVKFTIEKLKTKTEKGDLSKLAASGYLSTLAASGNESTVQAKGKNSIAASIGIGGKASGALGCYIVLAEWVMDKDGTISLADVKSAKVDGIIIKENQFYTLKNGCFEKA